MRAKFEFLFKYYRGDRLADIAEDIGCITAGGLKCRVAGVKHRRPRGAFTGNKREQWINSRPVQNLKSKYKLLHQAQL